MTSRRYAQALLALTVCGFLLRLLVGLGAAVVVRDGIVFLETAALFQAGDLAGGLSRPVAPLFPLWLALGALVSGTASEATGVVMASLAAAALVPAVAALTTTAYGRGAGLFAALLAAVQPPFVVLGGEVLSESIYLPLLAWTLVCFQRLGEGTPRAAGWAIGGALLGVAAYLARPEGIAFLGAVWLGLFLVPRAPAAADWPRRLKDAAWTLLPAALGVILFVLAIRESAVLGDMQAGELKLTLKRNLPVIIGQTTLPIALERLAEQVGWTLRAIGPSLPLVVLAWVARGRIVASADGAPRRLALLSALGGALLLLAFVLVRADRRYGAQLALLTLPHAGAGALLLVGWLRKELAHAQVRAGLAVLLLAVCLPFAWRTQHARKVSYRDAAAALRVVGAKRVLANDARAAYYAGIERVELLHHLPELARRRDPEAIVALAQKQGADAILLVVQDDGGKACSIAVRGLLDVTPTEIRRAGAVRLDLFVLP